MPVVSETTETSNLASVEEGADSGVDISPDSDSEQDEQLKTDKSVDFIESAVGWNVSKIF